MISRLGVGDPWTKQLAHGACPVRSSSALRGRPLLRLSKLSEHSAYFGVGQIVGWRSEILACKQRG